MTRKIFIVVDESDYDPSSLVGAFDTREEAQKLSPGIKGPVSWRVIYELEVGREYSFLEIDEVVVDG